MALIQDTEVFNPQLNETKQNINVKSLEHVLLNNSPISIVMYKMNSIQKKSRFFGNNSVCKPIYMK